VPLKYHPTPLSGGDREGLNEELRKAKGFDNHPGPGIRRASSERRGHDTARRRLFVPKLGLADVDFRRADRSIADDRTGDQRRPPLARNRMLTLQDTVGRRPGRVAPRHHDLRARPCNPPGRPKVRRRWETTRRGPASIGSEAEARGPGKMTVCATSVQ
jgi:hypothetical protein